MVCVRDPTLSEEALGEQAALGDSGLLGGETSLLGGRHICLEAGPLG